MDGICRAIASGIPVTLAGSTTVARPLDLAGLGECEYYLLAARPSLPEQTWPLAREFLADGQQDLADGLMDRAIKDLASDKDLRVVPFDDFMTWLRGRDGIEYSAWYMLRESRWDCRTLELCRELLGRASQEEIDEFARRRDMCSGLDPLAVCDWPLPPDPPPGKRRLPANAGGPKYHPWRLLILEMAEALGWPIEAVGKMTLYNVRAFGTPKEQLGGVRTESVGRNQRRQMGS